MLFNSFTFWLFFAVVLLANALAPPRWSRHVLVLASFVFYGAFNPMLLPLLGGCILFNYGTGLAIGRSSGRAARALVVVAIAANLTLLGFFKYYGFFIATASNLLALPLDQWAVDIVLPIAISFYTFEAIAYNVDVFRRDLPAQANLVDFALFISFFPHLVAGPIIRPTLFFPQIGGRPVPSGATIAWSAVQVAKGLVKKMVFADNFAVIADGYFNGAVGHGGVWQAWIATVAFSMQIYFDFSGYTDIARGCAGLLGYDFPPNFERPYLARDIAAFWRRWHISLSTWLRDYLYIPLGGNRHGTARTYANLLVTMGLGGLWHGASWNFAIWGLYHGVLLSLHRAWQHRPGARRTASSPLRHAIGVAITFTSVTVGWVAFRTHDFASTLRVLGDLVGRSGSAAPSSTMAFATLLALSALWLVADRRRRLQAWLIDDRGSFAMLRGPVSLALALLVLELFSRTDIAVPFIYFQF